MRKGLVLALAAALIVVGSPALADKAAFGDRNDTRGRLDMKRFTHGHAGGGSVVHTVTMFKGFPSRLLKAPSPAKKQLRPSTVWFFFDTNRDNRAERAVAVRWNRGKARAVVTNQAGGTSVRRRSRGPTSARSGSGSSTVCSAAIASAPTDGGPTLSSGEGTSAEASAPTRSGAPGCMTRVARLPHGTPCRAGE
ncbi:hypothetical protein BH20ACT23_BH20ACT23_04630 [soil metagenome]